jgi:hypothetical protein
MPPSVTDYGDLINLTASVHLLLGQAGAQDLSFSSPGTPGGGGGPGGDVGIVPNQGGPTTAPEGALTEYSPGGGPDAGEVADEGASGGEGGSGSGSGGGGSGSGSGGGGSGSGGGSGGGGGGSGGNLPFTGLEAGALAGIGAALVGAGSKLRRVVRRGRGPEHPAP